MDNLAGRLRVLSVDDDSLVQRALGLVLTAYDDLQLVGQAGSGEDAIVQCAEVQPDIVLMDLRIPGIDGVAATREIRWAWPHIQVIVLTNSDDPELIREVLQAGASRWLPKTISADELVGAIRGVYRSPMLQAVPRNGGNGSNGHSRS